MASVKSLVGVHRNFAMRVADATIELPFLFYLLS